MDWNLVQIGSKVSLFGERKRFVVRCKGERYIVLSKKFFSQTRCAVIDIWSDIALTDYKNINVRNDSDEEFTKLLNQLENNDIHYTLKNMENLNPRDMLNGDLKFPVEEYLHSSIMPDLLSSKEKIVRCRVPHECCVCGNEIYVGSYAVCKRGFTPSTDRCRISIYMCRACAEDYIERKMFGGSKT